MADAEALKLPKPVPPCEIRPELLNFNADRRWDLLAFVRPDEIEDVKACTVDPDGNRYYLVHWKDTWKPESSLIYCEKLLQQFWERKSLIHQDTLYLSTTPTQIEEHNVNKTNADILNELEQQVVAGETVQDPSYSATNVVLSPSFQEHETKHETDSALEGCTKTPSRDEESVEKPGDIDLVVTQVEERVKEEDKSPVVNNLEEDGSVKVETFKEEEMPMKDECEEDQETESHDDFVNYDDVTPESPGGTKELTDTKEEDQDLVDETDDADTSFSSSFTESPSKKGASKRKIRPPKQSMNTSPVKRARRSKKTKTDGNVKGPKISKTVNTVISSTSIPTSLDVGVIETEPSTSEDSKGNDFKCMVCDKHLTTQQNLMKHLLTHNNNHTCQICMRTFKSTHFLKHHMDKHNATYEYACPICNKKFKFKNNMRGHIRKHNMEKKFECEICQKKFMGRYNLKEHMKSHSDDRPFECVFCRKKYKDKGALNKHLLTHQDKKVECDICKRQFSDANQVKRHMQFHFSWPGDSFKRKVNNPDGEKTKHKCPHCDKVFNHYSNMNAHIHKKHKEKKIQCKHCSKMFAYQYELREHMFVHQNGGVESKFKCQFCDKYFQRSTTLKNHERTTHLGIKRFKCDVCGKQFGTKFNMKVHVEKLHNKDGTDNDKPPRRQRVPRDKPRVDNSLVPLPAGDPSLLAPGNHPSNVPGMGPPVSLTPPLLRNLSTSDIIRNAMTNIPELPYFPGLSARGYQFYGIPPPDFGVS